MHPFSIKFNTTDSLILQIISVILALFIACTWLYYNKHIKLILRFILGIFGGIVTYYIVALFFGVLQFFYTAIKDDISPNKQSATIVEYKEYVSKTKSNNRGDLGSRTRTNVFYTPLLNYRDQHGVAKKQYGDVSFSENNKEPIGTEIKVIIDNDEIRMITPIKTFAIVMNILVIVFMGIFYYIFYTYAKTGSFEKIGNALLPVFGFVIFPLALVIMTYLLLNIGYEYFILNKPTTSRNVAIFCSVLGIFLLLCLYGYIKAYLDANKKKQKKLKKQKNKTMLNQ